MSMALKNNVKDDIRASLNRVLRANLVDSDILYGKLDGNEEISDLEDLTV